MHQHMPFLMSLPQECKLFPATEVRGGVYATISECFLKGYQPLPFPQIIDLRLQVAQTDPNWRHRPIWKPTDTLTTRIYSTVRRKNEVIYNHTWARLGKLLLANRQEYWLTTSTKKNYHAIPTYEGDRLFSFTKLRTLQNEPVVTIVDAKEARENVDLEAAALFGSEERYQRYKEFFNTNQALECDLLSIPQPNLFQAEPTIQVMRLGGALCDYIDGIHANVNRAGNVFSTRSAIGTNDAVVQNRFSRIMKSLQI